MVTPADNDLHMGENLEPPLFVNMNDRGQGVYQHGQKPNTFLLSVPSQEETLQRAAGSEFMFDKFTPRNCCSQGIYAHLNRGLGN